MQANARRRIWTKSVSSVEEQQGELCDDGCDCGKIIGSTRRGYTEERAVVLVNVNDHTGGFSPKRDPGMRLFEAVVTAPAVKQKALGQTFRA